MVILRPIGAFVLAVALACDTAALASSPAWDEAMFDDPVTAPAGPEPARKEPADEATSILPSRIIGSRPIGRAFAWRKPSPRTTPRQAPRPAARRRPEPAKKRTAVRKSERHRERPFDAMTWLEATLEQEEARDLSPLPRRPARAAPPTITFVTPPPLSAPVGKPSRVPDPAPAPEASAMSEIGGRSATLEEALARVRAARMRQLPLQDPPLEADHHDDPASTASSPVAWR